MHRPHAAAAWTKGTVAPPAGFESAINMKEDPDKLFRLLESIGTGSYGDVFKVREGLTKGKDAAAAV